MKSDTHIPIKIIKINSDIFADFIHSCFNKSLKKFGFFFFFKISRCNSSLREEIIKDQLVYYQI